MYLGLADELKGIFLNEERYLNEPCFHWYQLMSVVALEKSLLLHLINIHCMLGWPYAVGLRPKELALELEREGYDKYARAA